MEVQYERALATASTSAKLSKVSFHFGEGPHAVQALAGVDLDIAAGEFVSILGPSGCGKSTILNAIGGFGKVSAGEVHVGQARVTGAGPDRGIVFQQHGCCPGRQWSRTWSSASRCAASAPASAVKPRGRSCSRSASESFCTTTRTNCRAGCSSA